MKKLVRITTSNSNEKVKYNTKAIINNSAIIYIEKDKNNTKTSFNYLENKLTRKNKEMSLEYQFIKGQETIGYLVLQDLKKTFKLKLTTLDIIKDSKSLTIKFTVENETIEYKIEVIE